jgi:thioredoxin-dependent peroxiredoxin
LKQGTTNRRELNIMKMIWLCISSILGCLAALNHVQAQANPPAKGLSVGDPAPRVSGLDQDDSPWKLDSLIGKNIVLLYFYPKDNTPGCTTEACGLRDRLGDLRKGKVEVVGVSFDSTASHRKFRDQYQLNFPLIADTDGKIADAYGARKGPDAKVARRVSFLIGLDGKIAHITDNPSATVHLDEMQQAIARLNK